MLKTLVKGTAFFAITLSLISIPSAKSAETYAIPTAPTGVTAVATSNGVTVKWNAVVANPPITAYVVSGGQGSCPIYVSPGNGHMQAFLPIPTGLTSITPAVQAVNVYGISPAAKTATLTGDSLAKAPRVDGLKIIQINHLSDFHGAIETTSTNPGTAILTTAFANDRKAVPATFTLASGDNFGASPAISTEFEEIPSLESMNLMKFDVSVFGNHEHDRAISHLIKMIGLSDFKWVVSNYSTLAPFDSVKSKVASYQIIERNGVKLGVVGANTPETMETVYPGNLAGITISPDPTYVNNAIKAAKDAGADVVVVIEHKGWSENSGGLAIGDIVTDAKNYNGEIAIFGAHTHLLYNSVTARSPKNGYVMLAQVPNSGVSYNQMTICMRGSKVLGSALRVVNNADIAKLTPDASAVALVKKYKDQLSSKLDVKIGQVSGIFPRGGSPAVERSGETEMGDYMADLVRASQKTQIAIINGGGIRDTFPAKTYVPGDTKLVRPSNSTTGPYDVTLGDALTVFPFGNYVATTKMSGSDLWKAMENGVSQYPTAGRFPQISGFKFSFDPSKPVGSRILSIKTLDGKDIPNDSSMEFTTATVDYMVSGGDGYVNVFHPSIAKIQGLLVDALSAGLKADLAAGKVTQLPKLDGRISKP